jgi:GT2 family glycosyltransferase
MDLAIVIVNFRTADLTLACLRSLAAARGEVGTMKTFVVENGSGDDSAPRLRDAIIKNNWSDWVELKPLDKNIGYAAGNNAAIRDALGSQDAPRYVLLLNPDTEVRPGALRELMTFMEQSPRVGIAGSRLEDPDGTPQRSAFRFPTIYSELDTGFRLGLISRLLHQYLSAPPVRDDAHQTDWVAGASMIVRREVFERVGLLDERYFMYYEEVDFCLQANRAGWPCWYVPASHVVHLVGQASGVTDTRRAPARRPAYWFESRKRFFVKNRGALAAIAADLAFSAGYVTWRLRRPLQGKPDLDPPYLLWDTLRHSLNFNLRGAR